MRTSKKILSVIVALTMLLGVVALGASAAGTIPPLPAKTVCQLSMLSDKDSYAAGDDIYITIYAQTAADCPELASAGQYVINYPSAVFEPGSTSTTLNDAGHGFSMPADQMATYDNSNSQVVFSNTLVSMGETISANDEAIGYFIAQDSYPWMDTVTNPTELFTIKLHVKDTAADGTYTINFNEFSYMGDNYLATVLDSFTGAGLGAGVTNSGTDWGFAEDYMWSLAPLEVTIGASGPVVAHKKAQVKMNLNAGKTALEGDKPIQLRVTSVITAADFTTYFANTTTHGTDTAPTASAITSVGIVAYKGAAADFSEATAKALVTDGTAAANYASAETDYISNVGGEYTFGAIIKGSRADAFASDVTYLGFVKYLDDTGAAQIIFYDAAVTKTITDQTVSDYIAAMNA